MLLLVSGRGLNITENSIVIQVADVPLQPLPHEPQTCQQNFCMVNYRFNNKLTILTMIWVHEEVREGFVEDLDGVFYTTWHTEERMKGSSGILDILYATSKEV